MSIGMFVLWVVLLAITLLRGRRRPDLTLAVASASTTLRVNRMVAPGFEEVRAEFERNFAERGEIGARIPSLHGDVHRSVPSARPSPAPNPGWPPAPVSPAVGRRSLAVR